MSLDSQMISPLDRLHASPINSRGRPPWRPFSWVAGSRPQAQSCCRPCLDRKTRNRTAIGWSGFLSSAKRRGSSVLLGQSPET